MKYKKEKFEKLQRVCINVILKSCIYEKTFIFIRENKDRYNGEDSILFVLMFHTKKFYQKISSKIVWLLLLATTVLNILH